MWSYQTAYLKANHPLPYMTHLINAKVGVTSKEDGYGYKVSEYVEEARRLGIPVDPPCVKRSVALCRIVWSAQSIRFGLLMIKGVSRGAVEHILTTSRAADSFKDFVLSTCVIEQVTNAAGQPESRPFAKVSKSDLEGLILAGALDVYDPDRSRLLAMLPTVMKLARKVREQEAKLRNGAKRQKLTPAALLSELESFTLEDYDVKDPMDLERQLSEERRVTGCFLSQSPFDPFRPLIARHCDGTVGQVSAGEWPGSGTITFPALLTRVKVNVCKTGRSKGKEMAFLAFAGGDGDCEAVCFTSVWEGLHLQPGGVERGKVYIVRANRDRTRGGAIVESMTRLSNCNFAAAA